MRLIFLLAICLFACTKPAKRKSLQPCHDVYFGGTDSIYFQGANWCFCPDSIFKQGRNGLIDDTIFWGRWWMTDLNTGPNGWVDSMTIVTASGDTVGYLATPLYWPHPFEVLLQQPFGVDVYLDQWPP